MKKCIWLILVLISWMPQLVSSQRSAPGLPQRTVTVTEVQELDFGQILLANGSNGGTVQITSNGLRNVTGDLVAYPGDNFKQGQFAFKLCSGRSISITYSNTVILSDLTGHQLSMTVDNIKIGSTTITSSGQSFFSNKNCDDYHLMQLGTTLSIAGSYLTNPPGTYNGSFSVTVAYQ